MTTQTIEPYKTSIAVNAPKDRAFALFTQNMDRWWPRSHSIGKSPQKEVVLECKAGGRWYEIAEDGSECQWGKVLAISPPDMLVLAWQISADWAFDPELLTEVEIKFENEGDSKTRVHLEHRQLENFGPNFERVKASIGSEGGWPQLLKLYAESAGVA